MINNFFLKKTKKKNKNPLSLPKQTKTKFRNAKVKLFLV